MYGLSKYTITSENIGVYEEIFENVKIIDCHTHIGRDVDGHKFSADDMIKSMAKANLDKVISFALNDPRDPNSFTAGNDEVLLASKVYKDKIIPFFRLNPKGSWKQEFNLRVEQGFRGIKLHPRSQNFPLCHKEALKIYKLAQDHKLPILVHAGFGLEKLADDFATIAKKFPRLKMIIGHAAFPDIDNTIKKVGKHKNFIFDTSTCKIFDLYVLMKNLPCSQIAFGSDVPYYNISLALQSVIDTAIIAGKSATDIRNILGGNIAKWLP